MLSSKLSQFQQHLMTSFYAKIFRSFCHGCTIFGWKMFQLTPNSNLEVPILHLCAKFSLEMLAKKCIALSVMHVPLCFVLFGWWNWPPKLQLVIWQLWRGDVEFKYINFIIVENCWRNILSISSQILLN